MKIGDITVEKIYVGDVEVTKCELSGVTVYISSGDTPTHDYSKDYDIPAGKPTISIVG